MTWGKFVIIKMDMAFVKIMGMASEKMTPKILKNGHGDTVKKCAWINDAGDPLVVLYIGGCQVVVERGKSGMSYMGVRYMGVRYRW